MLWDPRSDPWFSGFADGEAYFQLRRQNNRGWRIEPRFRIHLRADDGNILRVLADAFGGTVRVGKNGIWTPQVHWLVSSKKDLLGLVDYFDAFPLRAKKAQDCLLWCEAVRIYAANSGVHPDLFVLATRLLEARKFAMAGT